MPVHDWTRVDAGIFHNFHLTWISELCKALNAGLLPEGYYGLAEQHAGRTIPDVLTLHASSPSELPIPSEPGAGGTAVAEAPPKTRVHQRLENITLLGRRRSIAIRHISGHRLVALIEILSPGNKDRAKNLEEFADKVVDALTAGIHVLLIDLFPPGAYDPRGLHGVILELLENSDQAYDLPHEEPLTLASYLADTTNEAYLEHLAAGAPLPEMPLFITPERYVNTPLESTYRAAYRGMPAFWKKVLEGHDSSS